MPKIHYAAAALAATLAGATAARADLKVVQSTTIKNPQITAMMQSMSPQQRASMAAAGGPFALIGSGPVTSTIYSRGGKTRVDLGPQSTIVDLKAHTLTTINRATHTYTTAPFSPQAAGQVQANVQDTGQTKTISGHKARHYVMSLDSAQGGHVAGDVWSAPDIPQPPISSFGGAAGAAQGQLRKIKGMPLLANLTITGSPVGAITVHSVTRSISRAALPASLFVVPAGFRRAAR